MNATRYRLATNGLDWRVERQRRFLWWRWWSPVIWTDPRHPDVERMEFGSLSAAEAALNDFRAADAAKAHGWRAAR